MSCENSQMKSYATMIELPFFMSWLPANAVRDDGKVLFGELLNMNTALTELHLRSLLHQRIHTETMTHLDYSDNGIGDVEAGGLAVFLKTNTTLTQLDLRCELHLPSQMGKVLFICFFGVK